MSWSILKKLKNILIFIVFIFSLYTSFGQQKVAKGIVFDKLNHQSIEGAIVKVDGVDNIVYADEQGEFKIDIPKRRRYLLISKDGYKTAKTVLTPGFQHKNIEVKLTPLAVDSIFPELKDVISLSIFEFFNGAIALRYEHFLKHKHAVGIHTSFYLFGRNPTTLGSEYDHYVKYMGIKASPFYRYYPIRKKRFGLFGEGKVQVGYFNFSELGYYYGCGSTAYEELSKQSFWTAGVGISIGIMFRSRRGIGNLSIGYQYLPMNVPESIEAPAPGGGVLTYQVDSEWWYRGGPGTYVDVKLTFGIGF